MKLLVISHNPVSDCNAMGKTLKAFFSSFPKDSLCQLYISPGYPCEGVCRSFYRITDREVLESYFRKGLPGGPVPKEKIGSDERDYSRREEDRLRRNVKNQKPFRRLIRDLLWGGCFWFHEALRKWIEEEKPDCIFAAGGDGLFLYRIALGISREYGIPLVGYVCDEYYFLSPEPGLLPRLRMWLLRRKLEEFFDRASHLVVISPELQKQYAARFSLPVTVLMTGSSRPRAREARIVEKITHLTYLGNMTYGRWKSLEAIGQALERISRTLGFTVTLDIYAPALSLEAQAHLERCSAIRLRGFVQGEALEQVWQEAELLVHAEDFSPRNRELVRHSISTKIADALASGVPLLAYAPKEIASMTYLKRMDCAFLASRENLDQVLLQALSEPELRREKAEKGLLAAGIYHDRDRNSRQFLELIRFVTEETL